MVSHAGPRLIDITARSRYGNEVDTAPDPNPAGRLDDHQLRAWRGLMETSAQLRHRLDSLLIAESGLSGSDYPILVVLDEAGDRALRSSELADAIGWERSRLSHQLTRMERRGLVLRSRLEADSRGSDVRLTAKGRTILAGATGAHARAVRTHFVEALAPEQLTALAEIMAQLAAHLAATPAPTVSGRRTGPL